MDRVCYVLTVLGDISDRAVIGCLQCRATFFSKVSRRSRGEYSTTRSKTLLKGPGLGLAPVLVLVPVR